MIAVTLSFTALVGLLITQHRINRQAEEALIDTLRKTDGMASTTRTFFSTNTDIYAPHHEFKDLKQVPVVAAWSVARTYAEAAACTDLPGLAFDPQDLVNAFRLKAQPASVQPLPRGNQGIQKALPRKRSAKAAGKGHQAKHGRPLSMGK